MPRTEAVAIAGNLIRYIKMERNHMLFGFRRWLRFVSEMAVVPVFLPPLVGERPVFGEGGLVG